jgi:hypothetical protein
MIRKHFRLKRLVLGLAVAAFAAPASAQAMVIIDGPTGGEQAYVVQTSHPVASEMSVQSPVQTSAYQLKVDLLRSQAMNRMATTYPSVSQLGPLDAWAIGAISANQPGTTAAGTAIANARHDALPVSTVVTSTRTNDGFNWSDAGIGASVTFGAVLFLLTAVAFGRKYRGRIDRSGLASA